MLASMSVKKFSSKCKSRSNTFQSKERVKCVWVRVHVSVGAHVRVFVRVCMRASEPQTCVWGISLGGWL